MKKIKLELELTDSTLEQYFLNIINKSITNNTELIPGLKVSKIISDTSDASETSETSEMPINNITYWPATNCSRNCRKCNYRCLHRHEKYEEPKKYNGEWIDVNDKQSVEKMFGSFKL